MLRLLAAFLIAPLAGVVLGELAAGLALLGHVPSELVLFPFGVVAAYAAALVTSPCILLLRRLRKASLLSVLACTVFASALGVLIIVRGEAFSASTALVVWVYAMSAAAFSALTFWFVGVRANGFFPQHRSSVQNVP